MTPRPGERYMHPAWWTTILVGSIVLFLGTTSAMFTGALSSFIPVTLMSDRSGLVMESGAKVKLRGVEVGRVAGVVGGKQPVGLRLQIDPDVAERIPANVEAQIRSTTLLGNKFVDLVYPVRPSPQRLSAGAVLTSRNVTTEVNTVFENVVDILDQVDPEKLNATLSAVSDALRGQGERIGQAFVDANQVLDALNARTAVIGEDLRGTADFGNAYGAAADDIMNILDSAATVSTTVTNQRDDLDAVLLNAIGLADAGTKLLTTAGEPFVQAVTTLEPTTALLFGYRSEYTCSLLGAQWMLDHGATKATGGDGSTGRLDGSLALPADPYRYPDNLPIVSAKGGPAGKPGCGSLPDVTKAWPVPYLVTNTGFGTGLDMRPNPGIAHPWWVNFLPTTRAVPKPPSIRGDGPPARGPSPYPGAPPYGAPLFGPDGTPLWAPPPPGAPPPPVPGVAVPPPPYGPGAPSGGSTPADPAPTPAPQQPVMP